VAKKAPVRPAVVHGSTPIPNPLSN
jgi:hypothetical protein